MNLGDPVHMRLLVDHSCIECYLGSGEVLSTRIYRWGCWSMPAQARCHACAFTDGCAPCLGCTARTDSVAQGALPAVSKPIHEHPGCAALQATAWCPSTSPPCIVSILLDECPGPELCALPAWGQLQLQLAAPALFHSQHTACTPLTPLPACRGQPPPGADAGIDFVAYGGCAFVERWQAWNMRTIWRRELKARDSMGAAFETIYEPAMSG